MAVIDIKVISDAVCPFCYIGKKRLERAIDVYKRTVPGGADDRFTITWQPFYLDPTAPATGIPISERMASKFGASRVSAINARMTALGAAEGINFTHAGKVGNTRDAHRLVEMAKEMATKSAESMTGPSKDDPQNAIISSLFRSYFEEGGDITSRDMLVAAAERAGFDGAATRAWLESADDNGGAAVDAAVGEAFARGVHGVPHFIINDRVEVGGAQDVPTFVSELMRSREAAK